MRNKADYTIGSGNVYADLGFPDAEEMLAKAELAHKIAVIIERRRLTQTRAAAALGIDQPKVSALLNGHLSAFSIERLVRFLLRLGRDVEIVVREPRKAKRRPARLMVA